MALTMSEIKRSIIDLRGKLAAAEKRHEEHLAGCAVQDEQLEKLGLVDESGDEHAGCWRNKRADAAERERDEARKALRMILDCRHPNDESLPLADMLPDDVRHVALAALDGEPAEPAPQGQAEGDE